MSSKNFMSYEDATTVLGAYAEAISGKQDVLLYGGVNPSTGADGDMYVKLVRDESTLIDMFGSPSAESTDEYEMSYTVASSVMGDYYNYEAFGTGKGFGQNGRGSMTITYHFKKSRFKPANVSYCNNFNLSGGGYLESADFAIKASNDGTNWDTLYSTTSACPRDTSVSADIATNSYYSYFKFEMNSYGGYTGIRNIVMNGISESYSNIDNIYFKNDGTWLKDTFAKKSELDAKQDTLTFDDVPTANSNNPVKSGGVKSAIDIAVSSAYHHAGTKTVAQLTHDLLVAANEGNVYNITDSGTTTSDFIEGIGKTIDEGSNVGICKVGNDYMFDLLSGFIDTTNFVQKSSTAGLIMNDGTIDTVAKQPVTDNNLTTTDKTTTGAINELKSGLTNLGNIRTYVIPANGSVNIKITKVGFVLYAPARSAFFMDAISYDQGYLDTILGDKTSSNRNTYTVVSDTNIRVTSSMNWDIAIIVLSA